ncbi:MAG TPA: hypothetical protein VIM11_27985 [Tepidisphaeraceae bacterium]|jgi:hypothetical protein
MQKALTFLEQHVQWLALGLGGVFFLFCVWAYVYTPPATATLTGKREPVSPGQIDELTRDGPVREIEQSINSNGDLAIMVPDVVKPWQAQMDATNAKIFVQKWSRPLYTDTGIFSGPGPTTGPGNDYIAALPTLPKAVPLVPTAGLSVVSMPVNQKNAPGGVQAVVNSNFDQEWATASFTIPATDLKTAFAAVLANKGKGLSLTTDILHVELKRQRGTIGPNGPVFPNGEEGVETVAIPKMLQADARPLPVPKASIPEKASYKDWAEKNIDVVYQPKFYDVHGGTPWVPPSAAPAPGAAAAAGAPKGIAGIPPALPPRVIPGAQPNPAIPGAAGGRNPGEINPEAIAQDILIWAHDDTVEPGQVYRYRIVYYMKNPVMGLTVIADDKIVDVLAVPSPPSDWSQPVTLPQTTKFWFASLRGNAATADVYHWENGGWIKKTPQQSFSPGDRVADSEWTVVDVHGTLPNSRDRDKYVLLTNDAGEVIRRSPNADRSNEERKALEIEINGAAAPKDAAPARGTGNGRPVPANNPGNRAAAPMPRGG